MNTPSVSENPLPPGVAMIVYEVSVIYDIEGNEGEDHSLFTTEALAYAFAKWVEKEYPDEKHIITVYPIQVLNELPEGARE